MNIIATKKIIDEITAIGAKLVFFSTVEVFDGAAGNYAENAVPRPLNLYGRMKTEIENHLTAHSLRSRIVRTGWNVGWAAEQRCVIAMTYETLLRPGAKMARDNYFSINDVRDTAAGLLRICEDGDMPVCHLAASPPVCRLELAAMVKEMSCFGCEMDYKEVAFADIPYSEPRGRLNHLDCRRTVSRYGLTFRKPAEVIRDKVALLDRSGWVERLRSELAR